jgi:hypothetical protein
MDNAFSNIQIGFHNNIRSRSKSKCYSIVDTRGIKRSNSNFNNALQEVDILNGGNMDIIGYFRCNLP